MERVDVARVAHPSHPKIVWFIVKPYLGVAIYLIDMKAIVTTRRTVVVRRKALIGRRCAEKEFTKRIF